MTLSELVWRELNRRKMVHLHEDTVLTKRAGSYLEADTRDPHGCCIRLLWGPGNTFHITRWNGVNITDRWLDLDMITAQAVLHELLKDDPIIT